MGKKVIRLAQAAPEAALAGLNRLTGLRFSSWPESLVAPSAAAGGPERESAESDTGKRGKPRPGKAGARARKSSGH